MASCNNMLMVSVLGSSANSFLIGPEAASIASLMSPCCFGCFTLGFHFPDGYISFIIYIASFTLPHIIRSQ